METGCFYVVHAETLYARHKVSGENSALEAVKTGLQHVKLKNLHYSQPLPGNGW
jgi:hypothetical protein